MPNKPKRSRTAPEDATPVEEPEAPVEDAPAAAEEVAPAKAPRATQTALPDKTPKHTAERAFASRKGDPLVQAFLHDERLQHRTRRLTRAEWKVEFETFLAAPRS